MSMATEPKKGQSKFVVTDVDGGSDGGSVGHGVTNRAFEIDMDNNLNAHGHYPLQEFTNGNQSKINGELQAETKSRDMYRHSSTPKKSGQFFPSIWLLLWKNTLLRRRHFVVTALEIILPTLFACLIAFFKTWTPPTPPVETSIITNSTQFFERDLVKEIGRWKDRRRNGTYILGYAPANKYTEEIMRVFNESLLKYKLPLRHEMRGFPSEDKIKDFNAHQGLHLEKGQKLEILRAAIIFEKGFDEDQLTSQNKARDLAYKIRMVDKDYKTDQIYAPVKFPGPDTKNAGKGYQDGGFASIQVFLDKAITSVITNQTLNFTMSVQGFPYPPYKVELDFSRIFVNLLPQFLVFGFVFIVPSILRNVVAEKESGIKELMKMMGLRSYLHWIGWMLDSVLILVIPTTIVTFVLFKEFNPETGAFLIHSNPFLWWLVILLYVISAVSCLFFISTFFQKATMAIAVGVVSWIILYFVVMVPLERNYEWLSLSQKMLSCLLPNMGLHWSVKLMYSFEAKGIGATWSNIGQPLNTLDDFAVGHVMLMLIISSGVYMMLTMYFECIMPTKYGITKPWYFIFKPSFWATLIRGYSIPEESTMNVNGRQDLPEGFEVEPLGLKNTVEIRKLRKEFGKKVAVSELSLNMFEGHITVLLGCNGAGKTTLISMLTGLYNPSAGTAKINGFDIRKDMTTIRTQLGYCSQYNILFEQLTVTENMQFCGRLKGSTLKDVNEEIGILLEKLNLSEKKHALAGNLSGGQKRKLSLGMAIVGGSKIVIMDEPTAGMDPEARRGIWDLLLEARENRTMLLTTHFMEEADILGDRVAIMSGGKIHCCGSTLFLKKHYGSGYTLKMSVYAPPKSDSDAIFALVQKYAPDAYWEDEISSLNQNEVCDISIVLPRADDGVNDTSRFPAMFAELQREKSKLGIIDIGLPLTTLDDVFAKVVEETSQEQAKKELRNGSIWTVKFDDNIANEGEVKKLTGFSLTLLHIYALIMKRVAYTIRNPILFAAQLLLPLLLVLASVQLFNSMNAPLPPLPPLKIDLAPYKNPKLVYATTNSTSKIGEMYEEIIKSVPASIHADVYKVVDDPDIDSALLKAGRNDELQYRERYVAAADFSENHIRAMFQTLPTHASPLSINLASNALLRYLTSALPGDEFSLSLTNHPMKSGLNSLLESCTPNPRAASTLPLLYALVIPLGLSTMAAGFIVFPLEERLSRAKQLQIMTGINTFVFWMSSFVWDLFLVILLAAVMVGFFPILEADYAFTTANGAFAFFLIIVVYGVAAISFSYLFSLLMSTIAGGFAFITLLHLVTGTIWSIWVHGLEQSNFFDLADIFRWAGRVFPTFGASMSMIRFVDKVAKNVKCNMVTEEVKSIICNPNITEFDSKVFVEEFQACCDNCKDFESKGVTCFQQNEFLVWQSSGESEHIPASVELPGIGQELLAMLVMSIFYFFILFLFEFLRSRKGFSFGGGRNTDFPHECTDTDVLDENKRVNNLVRREELYRDAIVVENVCKRFGTFAAVSNLSFGVHRGECYGLLGVNGAGKTTLFQMMTGNMKPSCGNVHICCHSLKTSVQEYMKRIGYCPQYDGLIDCLTGREMLELFCRLRGIPPGSVASEVRRWLRRYGLTNSGNVSCGNYSGGMKRRLSAAIAMVGQPKIIMLDEPTSGVDPVSRRQLWSLVKAGKSAGQALILTSHSMEECEALCSRLSIMVAGQLQVSGTVQHLKSKLSQGFAITMKINQQLTPAERAVQIQPLCDEVSNAFTPCVLKESHENVVEYQVKNTEIDWEAVFTVLEGLKQKYAGLLEDYSVSETTLEEIFLSVAKSKNFSREVQVPIMGKALSLMGC